MGATGVEGEATVVWERQHPVTRRTIVNAHVAVRIKSNLSIVELSSVYRCNDVLIDATVLPASLWWVRYDK
jgi:hypothetical protein